MGGRAFPGEDGNATSGKMLEMVVEGQNVYIVSRTYIFIACA